MSFSVGIIGLPNVGKSTLFKAITKKQVAIASHPFTTIQPNIGIVAVPDKRLKEIAKIVQPEKITEATIKFVDIAGLVKGAHKGEGLGNQFLAHIRNCDALVEVVRNFENPNVEHIEKNLSPKRDIDTIKVELLMKDLEGLEKIILKLEKEVKIKDKKTLKRINLLKKLKESVSRGKLISGSNLTEEEKAEIKEYQFLTVKPVIYLLNADKKNEYLKFNFNYLAMNLKDEEEISELSETGLSESEIKELKKESRLDQLILTCYNVLDLINFFTIKGEKEVRAWTLKRGSDIITAAEKVHSDFKKKFVKAEVIPWQKLINIGSWTKAKELGQIKTAGKEYVVQDGDIIEFKI